MRATSVIKTFSKGSGVGLVRGAHGKMSLFVIGVRVDPRKLVKGAAIYTNDRGDLKVRR